MAQHKSPTQVQIASTATESEFRDFVVRYWKAAAIVLLAVAAAVFIRQYLAEQARAAHSLAWNQLGKEVEIDRGAVQTPDVSRLAELAALSPESDASVWAALLEVEARIESGDFEGAQGALDRLLERRGTHPTLSRPLPLEEGRELETLGEFLKRRIEQESAWRAAHSKLFAEPESVELVGPPAAAQPVDAATPADAPVSSPAPQ
jgi:hypothetical protein